MKQVSIPSRIEALVAHTCNACLTVHRALGPGLLESAYHECLAIELSHLHVPFEREKEVPIVYRGCSIPHAYRLDFIVGNQLLIELKAVEGIQAVHRVQVQTYLKLLQLPLGLLINFNVPLIKDGIHRVLNLDFQVENHAPVESAPTPQLVRSSAPSRLRV